MYLLLTPLPQAPLPIVELHNPLPPPILTGAPLFIAAVKHLRKPWLLPDVPQNGLVAFTSAIQSSSGMVSYVGVGRVVSEGGIRGAVERRAEVMKTGEEKDEGKFCDILCIIGDQYVPTRFSFSVRRGKLTRKVYGNWDRNPLRFPNL